MPAVVPYKKPPCNVSALAGEAPFVSFVKMNKVVSVHAVVAGPGGVNFTIEPSDVEDPLDVL